MTSTGSRSAGINSTLLSSAGFIRAAISFNTGCYNFFTHVLFSFFVSYKYYNCWLLSLHFLNGSVDFFSASSGENQATPLFSSDFMETASSESASSRYVTFKCKWLDTYFPFFTCPSTVRDSKEKNLLRYRTDMGNPRFLFHFPKGNCK